MWSFRLLLVALLAAMTCARPVHDFHSLISLGVSQEDVEQSALWALLTLHAPDVEFADNVTIAFQRVMKETPEDRKYDFIGLYEKLDGKAYDPWNWDLVDPHKESGSIELQANRVGELELRLVRPPNKVLARVPLKVHAPCTGSCYKHGSCVKGECVCHVGYSLPDCSSPDPVGLAVEPFDGDIRGDFQVNLPVKARIHHRHKVEMNGRDYVGIYPADSPNGTQALSWKAIPADNLTQTVELTGVREPGQYILRVTRRSDLVILTHSKPFTVYEYCPNQCHNHGNCVEGKCACDEPFFSTDCALQPGMVTLNVLWPDESRELKRNDEISIEFSRVFDPEHPDILSDADWIGLYASADDNVTEPFAYQYTQVADGQDTDAQNQTGRVAFMVPPASDSFVFKYIRNDLTVLASTDPIPVYKPCKPEDCSGHGDCDDGVCVCEAGWTGEGCELGDVECALTATPLDNVLLRDVVEVSYTIGLGAASPHDFIGVYAEASGDNSNGLFAYNSTNGTVSDNTFSGKISVAVPKTGRFQLRWVDIFSKKTHCELSVFEVYAQCPKECSGNGNCIHGECQCAPGYLTPDCQRATGEIKITPPSEPVRLNPNFLAQTELTFSVNKPEGWYDPGDFIGLYPMGDEVSTLMVIAYVTAPADSGNAQLSLNFSSAVLPGKYRLWYLKGGSYERWAESAEFSIVTDCNEGTYNLDTNKCDCPDTKEGRLCEADTCCFSIDTNATRYHIGDTATISWSRPNKNGRDSDFIGLYLHNATEWDAPYAYQFAVAENGTNHGTVTLDIPPKEETFTLHYISSSGIVSKQTGPTVYVTIPCDPEDCSGHGVCISGQCTCSYGYGGAKCDKTVPEETSVTIESPGALAPNSMFSVHWTRTVDAGKRGDYIGLYKRLDNSDRPVSYAYVPISNEQFEGTLSLMAPSVAGTYQARFLSVESHQVLASSQEVDVE